MTPAEIILDQLGGNMFIRMTGSKNFIRSKDGYTLTMELAENKSQAQFLRISLTPMDVYTMEFLGVKQRKHHGDIYPVETFEGVYCDMLQDIFTEVTGLYTSL